ncbi:MAG: sigma 54-interacting transcriptional regulator [Phycisphaerae bacterium]|nr:sigma 54-interacting transcriptional regulator [Phycisphaerae bacterium]
MSLPRGTANVMTREGLQAILDSLTEGLVTIDDTGRVVGINRAACEILEVEPDQAIQAGCPCILGKETCASGSVLRTSIRERRPVKEFEVEIEMPSGRRKVLSMDTAVLRDAGNEAHGGVVLVRDVTELATLRRDLGQRHRLHGLVGKSKVMQEVYRLIEEVAESEATVLIEGESGTGKELVARAIHSRSPRAGGPFVAVTCSALAESVLESELFGHVRGAFTGAVRDKQGRFESGGGGTVFLDEIGDVSQAIQVKLLRVLQERTIERVGAEESMSVDIRVVSATNQPLAELASQGRFRKDLYYRLRVVPIRLPALRDRRDDIPILADHFISRFAQQTGRPVTGIDESALGLMLDYAWPGNVRELENAIEYGFVKAREGRISEEHLPPELRECAVRPARPRLAAASKRRADLTMETVRDALMLSGWSIAKAARHLRISRTTLYKRMKAYDLRPPVT